MCKEKKVTYSTQEEIIYTPETMIQDEEQAIYSVSKEVEQRGK